jgi:glycosidase
MPTSIRSPAVDDALAEARIPRTVRVKIGNRRIAVPKPFPSPPDWRDRWIYFLLVDRFAHPDAPPRILPYDAETGDFQGGSFAGIRERLPYLRDLGVGALWLSPVLKNCQWKPDTMHGYGIQDFLAIEPRFASDPQRAEEEFADLVEAAHAHGLHVIADIVLNHGGDLFAYPDGDAAPFRDDGEYPIAWRDADGRPVPAWQDAASIPAPPDDGVVWPQELQRNACWRRKGASDREVGDFATLKELVSADPGVRDALIRAYTWFIAEFDIDGFRIDTLKYVEPGFARAFGNAMREFAQSIGKRDFFTFGEVWDGDAQIARFIGRNAADEDESLGVDAALDFPLYERLGPVLKGLQPPAALARMYDERRIIQRGLMSSHGEASRFFVTFLDNHDIEQRFHFQPPGDPGRFDDQLTMALTCLFTLQGIPCLYYGTEQGLHGIGSRREAVREALWGRPSGFDSGHPFALATAALARLRLDEPALRYGRQYMRPVSGNGSDFGLSSLAGGVLAYSRILVDREVVVVANTSTTMVNRLSVLVDAALTPEGARFALLHGNQAGAIAPAAAASGPSGRSVQVTLRPMEAQVLALG